MKPKIIIFFIIILIILTRKKESLLSVKQQCSDSHKDNKNSCNADPSCSWVDGSLLSFCDAADDAETYCSNTVSVYKRPERR